MKTKLLIPLMVFLTACHAEDKPVTDSQKELIYAEAKTAVNELINSLELLNADKIIESQEDSPDYCYINSGVQYDFNRMKELVYKMRSEFVKQTMEPRNEKFVVIDASCFIYTGLVKNVMYLNSGQSITYEDEILTYAFRKTQGKWKMFYGHVSMVPK